MRPNLRSGVPTFFLRREGTPDTITLLFVCRPLIKISVSENVGDAISGKELTLLQEVASWAGITQGTNSVNLHAVRYSTADKNMVYFVKHAPPVSFVMSKFQKQNFGEGTVPLCKPTKNKEFCGGV